MIVVRVELLSARTGRVLELARMHIFNSRADCRRGERTSDYGFRILRGRSSRALDRNQVQRTGEVRDWKRLDRHVWNLVAEGLKAMGYGR